MRTKIFAKKISLNKSLSLLGGIILFCILNILGALVKIPLWFTPVPFTLQSLFVMLSGAFLGIYGSVSQVIYILLGVLGVPVFTNTGSGLIYFFGPTTGYLLGFVLGSMFVAKLIKLCRTHFQIFLVFLCSAIIILVLGTSWLMISLNLDLIKALILGFLPFIIPELIKSLIALKIYLWSKILFR